MISMYQVIACIVVVLGSLGAFSISTVVTNFLNRFYKVKDISWIFGLIVLIIYGYVVIRIWRYL